MVPQTREQRCLLVDAVDEKVLVLAVLLDGKHVVCGQVLAEADGPETSACICIVGVVVSPLEVLVVRANRQNILQGSREEGGGSTRFNESWLRGNITQL